MATIVEVASIVTPIAVPIIGGIIVWVRSVITNKNKKIELLEQKVDAQNQLITELKNQNLELRVTGDAVKRVFAQLPHSPSKGDVA